MLVKMFVEFVVGVIEIKGSWWLDWLVWLFVLVLDRVVVDGVWVLGEGVLFVLGEVLGDYVRMC